MNIQSIYSILRVCIYMFDFIFFWPILILFLILFLYIFLIK